jgi:hypothetical protein
VHPRVRFDTHTRTQWVWHPRAPAPTAGTAIPNSNPPPPSGLPHERIRKSLPTRQEVPSSPARTRTPQHGSRALEPVPTTTGATAACTPRSVRVRCPRRARDRRWRHRALATRPQPAAEAGLPGPRKGSAGESGKRDRSARLGCWWVPGPGARGQQHDRVVRHAREL